MTQSEALALIQRALDETLQEHKQIRADTDLLEGEFLDSLESMVFLLELEKASGLKIPQEEDLVELGYYNVPKLLALLGAARR
jgi:acyl carrier protein